MSICTHRDTKRTRQTKISKLEIVILVDQQVLGLQITVENPM